MTMHISYGKISLMIQSTLTSKGQTTIPFEVRRALELKPGMRLIYEVKDDYIIVRSEPALMDMFGILKSKKTQENFQQARETATRAWTRKTSLKS